METFTKEERNAIYKQALIEANEDIHFPYGICHWIGNAAERLRFGRYTEDMAELYPEIEKHRPFRNFMDKTYADVYWFDPRDKQIRIDILKQAIKETE